MSCWNLHKVFPEHTTAVTMTVSLSDWASLQRCPNRNVHAGVQEWVRWRSSRIFSHLTPVWTNPPPPTWWSDSEQRGPGPAAFGFLFFLSVVLNGPINSNVQYSSAGCCTVALVTYDFSLCKYMFRFSYFHVCWLCFVGTIFLLCMEKKL